MYPNAKTFMLTIVALSLLLCGLSWADESDLVWSTYLGGSEYDCGYDITADVFGNLYLIGCTVSGDFPVTTGSFDTTYNGADDIFVTKLSMGGDALAFSAFLGGSGYDHGQAIAVDDCGCAYVTGYTRSADFPTTAGAFDTTFYGWKDVFVTKLGPAGGTLVYSTLLGESGYHDEGHDIAVDCSGCAYVIGCTDSSDFPTTSGAFDETHNGHSDAFVTKISPTGSSLYYSTFIGGSGHDGGYSIAIDDYGNVFGTGYTTSGDQFPTTPGAFDRHRDGAYDAFVVKLNSAGSALDYCTFLGGSDFEFGYGIAIDESGNTYVTGETQSTDFPTTAGAFDITYNGGSYAGDVFVTKLNPTGNALSYSTYLGGLSNDYGRGIAVDDSNNTYVIGWTRSADFPTTSGAFDTTYNDLDDCWVAKFNPTGSSLVYSTFLGGMSGDQCWGIDVIGLGSVYMTGLTWSADFPITAGAFDTTYDNSDAFVAKFDLSGYPPTPVVLASFEATGGQGYITLIWITASEINCQRWEIYRGEREDGEYLKIGQLSAHGSTETTNTYQWVDRHVQPGKSYSYKLKQVDFDGTSWWSHVISTTAGSIVPKTCVLHQNYPNPFNANTEIRYQIPKDGHVTLKVFNTLGQEVLTLVDVYQKAGMHVVNWNGRDATDHEVASGIYFCRLNGGHFGKTVKMVLIK